MGKGKNGKFPIYLRLIYNRQKAEICTDYRINENDWDDGIISYIIILTLGSLHAPQKIKTCLETTVNREGKEIKTFYNKNGFIIKEDFFPGVKLFTKNEQGLIATDVSYNEEI
jgi:hypothetical protein